MDHQKINSVTSLIPPRLAAIAKKLRNGVASDTSNPSAKQNNPKEDRNPKVLNKADR